MAEVQSVLKPVLKKIAEEHEYHDYTTEVSLTDSGGANYTSQLYNITLSAPGKDDIKLFAKVGVMCGKIQSMNTKRVSEIESIFYTKIVSQYRTYEEQYKIPREDRLIFSKFYGVGTDYMNELLVLEDLKAKGYQTFDRFKCYDWGYASKCISYLAKFHALSVRYERDFTEEFSLLSKTLDINPIIDDIKSFMEKSVVAAIEVIGDEYKERLTMIITENMTHQKFKAFYDPSRKVVLNHGDFRPSNIMHKTNDVGELEIVALDYQMPYKGNPLADLLHFFIAGSDEDFRQKYFNKYFEHYYEEFSRALRKLHINPDEVYTKDQFDEDVKEFLPFGITLGLMILPIITVNVQDAPKLEDGIDFDSFAVEPNKLFHERFGGLLRDYVKMKIL